MTHNIECHHQLKVVSCLLVFYFHLSVHIQVASLKKKKKKYFVSLDN